MLEMRLVPYFHGLRMSDLDLVDVAPNEPGREGAPTGSPVARKSRDVVLYERRDIDNALSEMTPAQIDALPFGVIKVDRKGKILLYNATEGLISGRDPARVVGRNFFREIAPCTNRAEFLGRFVEGLKTGKLDTRFKYLFDFRMNPTIVSVHLRNSYHDDNVWIVIQVENSEARSRV